MNLIRKFQKKSKKIKKNIAFILACTLTTPSVLGLYSMEIEEEIIHIYGDYTSFGTLANALEELKLEVKKAALERIATNPVEFSEEQLIDIEKLLDRIEEDDDVQAVFTNIA